MSHNLTIRQLEVVAFVNRFRSREQCNPTCNEIAMGFGWASANAANAHLHALARKGAVMFRPNKARGYLVLRNFMGVGVECPYE